MDRLNDPRGSGANGSIDEWAGRGGLPRLRGMKLVSVAIVGALLVAASPARADAGDVIDVLEAPGDSASGLGWDGEHLWVANLQTALGGGSNVVTQHDPDSGDELGEFGMAAGHIFHGLAFDATGDIWTDDFNQVDVLLNDIVRVDPDNGDILETRPAYGTIYGVAIDVATERMFQVDNHGENAFDGDLYVLDLGSGDLIDGPIETSVRGARGVAWDGAALWVASNETDTVYRVDVADGTTITHIVGPGEGGVEGVAYGDGCLWISDTSDDMIYRVDTGEADLPECTLDKEPEGETDGGEEETAGSEESGSADTTTSNGTSGGSTSAAPPNHDSTEGGDPPASDSGGAASAPADPPSDPRGSGCSCRTDTRPPVLLPTLLLLACYRRRLSR